MNIQFKNKHIFFSVESIWQQLNYKFKYQLNQLVTADSEDDFVQTVDIDAETLISIYQEVSSKNEGVAKSINQEMLDVLQPQLMALSNIEDVQAGAAQPNEASLAIIGIDKINQANKANEAAKILNGKTQILL